MIFMINDTVVQLARDLVAIPSETHRSNKAVCDFLQSWLESNGFTVERLHYMDPEDTAKVNLVAKKGAGTGGLGFFSHADTVSGDPRKWDPFDPVIEAGRLIGRGGCDMKGPLAATLIAAAGVAVEKLEKPVYIVITSDEENGHQGAHYLLEHSKTLRESRPEYAIVAEPTSLQPVYAHKGNALITVTAHGRAAHTSTERGVSANFLIAPFLADMAALVPVFRETDRFKNHEFNPPTNGFNLTISDGDCPHNVSAEKTVASVGMRLMPDTEPDTQIAMVEDKALSYGLEVSRRRLDPFYIKPDAAVVQAACRATGISKPVTVPYGTEAEAYQKIAQTMILGPGDIAQAHTIGEWIDIAQLKAAVGVYANMIEQLCLSE
jgi:acetylornithine deacetylase